MPASTKVVTSAGSSLAISAAVPATNTSTAYAALTWTPIAQITDLGSTGREYNLVSHQPLAERGVVQLKGSYTDGQKTVQAAYVPGDPGQVIVATALDDDAQYSFKETYQNGTVKYFQAQVTSAPVNVGGTDSITAVTVNLSIKSGSLITVQPA